MASSRPLRQTSLDRRAAPSRTPPCLRSRVALARPVLEYDVIDEEFRACAAIVVLGVRFVLQPRQATLDFGIAVDNLRGLTEIKGARDVTSGVVPLMAWASAGSTTLGWVLVAAAITPTADALIVLTNDGKLSRALGVHGLTAALLVAAGFVLALA